jgi:hypothetical protein
VSWSIPAVWISVAAALIMSPRLDGSRVAHHPCREPD